MTNTLPTETQIIVVGAGPTGLAAAISLIYSGIDPSNLTIVDCVEKGANTSRALTIHAATLEALDKYDCASRLIELGIKGTGWRLGDKTSTIFQATFDHIASYTKFPFVLILEQSTTERVLEGRLKELGVEVKRPWRVTGMRDSKEFQGTDILFESGETVRTRYVIGADGARSSVRQLSGINFADPDGKSVDDSVDPRVAQMVLADVTISLPEDQAALQASGISLTASEAGMFLLVPLGKPTVSEQLYSSSDTVYRIGFNVPRGLGEPPSKPSLEYLQNNTNLHAPSVLSSDPDVNPNPVRITKVHWSTRFRMRSALAEVFFKRVHGGIVFLLGDAAHIHSPAGMNLGLRDAAGLGPVLADHIRRRESKLSAPGARNWDVNDMDFDTTTLEDYAASRRIRGLENIRLTKDFTNILNFVSRPHLLSRLLLWIFKLLLSLSIFQSRLVYRLSGLGNR
ncbi:FAD/NAD(P)-binding domain-containing protein [Lentinula novae-zelandiae]|nr:FAD/NAD(P)-binding domain-containing protein [Lentinula novae-zelandiae]